MPCTPLQGGNVHTFRSLQIVQNKSLETGIEIMVLFGTKGMGYVKYTLELYQLLDRQLVTADYLEFCDSQYWQILELQLNTNYYINLETLCFNQTK